MKNRVLLLLSLLILAGCQRKASVPDNASWTGSVELPDGITVPLRMNLDFSAGKPAGYFLVADEKTAIPEISKNGDSVTLAVSEYGAEIRAVWDGARLNGNYLRIRSDGTKSFKFAASPEPDDAKPAATGESSAAAPSGNFQVVFQDEKADKATVAKFWTEGQNLFGTLIAPDGDYGLLVGKPTGSRIQLSRF